MHQFPSRKRCSFFPRERTSASHVISLRAGGGKILHQSQMTDWNEGQSVSELMPMEHTFQHALRKPYDIDLVYTKKQIGYFPLTPSSTWLQFTDIPIKVESEWIPAIHGYFIWSHDQYQMY